MNYKKSKWNKSQKITKTEKQMKYQTIPKITNIPDF